MESLLATLPLTIIRTALMVVVNEGVRAAIAEVKKLWKEHKAHKAEKKKIKKMLKGKFK